jgi:hypothetical protein
MFRVGQKVVCVDDGRAVHLGCKLWDGLLKKGALYTISGVNAKHPDFPGVDAVHLAEIRRPNGMPFGAWRFRPVVERKTDISIFLAMLNKSPAKQPENA